MGRMTSAIRSVLWRMQVYSLLLNFQFELLSQNIFPTDNCCCPRLLISHGSNVVLQDLLSNYLYRTPPKLLDVFTGVCLLFCLGEGVPMWPFPMMHWTSLYRAPIGPSPSPSRHGTQLPDPSPSDIWWSLDVFIRPHCIGPPTGTDIWWPPKHV